MINSPNLVVTKHRKDAVKRQIFSPEKPTTEQLDKLDLITPEDLFGPKEQSHTPSYFSDIFDDCNMIHNFSNEGPPLKRKKTLIMAKAVVHFNDNIEDSCKEIDILRPKSTLDTTNWRPSGTMVADENGIIYLSKSGLQSYKGEEKGQVLSNKKPSQKRMQSENNLDLIISVENYPDFTNSNLNNSHEGISKNYTDLTQVQLVHHFENNDNLPTKNKPYSTMAIDRSGVVYLSSISQDNILSNNADQNVQEAETTPLKPKGRKKEKNPLKWKRTASKLAWL